MKSSKISALKVENIYIFKKIKVANNKKKEVWYKRFFDKKLWLFALSEVDLEKPVGPILSINPLSMDKKLIL